MRKNLYLIAYILLRDGIDGRSADFKPRHRWCGKRIDVGQLNNLSATLVNSGYLAAGREWHHVRHIYLNVQITCTVYIISS